MATKAQKMRNDPGLAPSRQGLNDAPVKHRKGKHNLQELVERIPKGYKCEEVDLDDPIGKEVSWIALLVTRLSVDGEKPSKRKRR